MNGLGIGTSVGLGALIGVGIVAPNTEVIEYLATGFFYGGMVGFLYEVYHLAFTMNLPRSRR